MSSYKKTRLQAATFSFKGRGRLSKRKDMDVDYVAHKQVIGKKRKTTWTETLADDLYDTAPTSASSSRPHKRGREDIQGLPSTHEEFDTEFHNDFFSYTDKEGRKTKVCKLMHTD
jgi:hypothetical protein